MLLNVFSPAILESVQTVMTQEQSEEFVRRLRFPADVERLFQEHYYRHILASLRASFLIFFIINVLSALAAAKTGASFELARLPPFLFLGQSGVYLLLFLASFRPQFMENWQLCVVLTTLVFFAFPDVLLDEAVIQRLIPFLLVGLVVIWGRLQRLQFRWLALQFAGIGLISVLTDVVTPSDDQLVQMLLTVVVLPVTAAIPLVWTLKSERSERKEFFETYLLSQERNAERQKREQTEQMLHILSQAIGGIVHDLGNPLTAVQGGADTLRTFAEAGDLDKNLALEFTDMISDGAQMLNYLRLSLMEQTRVLEGKPVPVELGPQSILHIVKAGARFQKPRFASGRTVSFGGDDLEVCVDEMRFITVFMNLIGNALKYSGGEVRVMWAPQGEHVLIAVQDQGQKGFGISRQQAEKLFVPFGRLDTHAQIEGTGLGLLSVRKIAEAHGGEIYIEGYTDGTSASAPFSTAQSQFPATLNQGFVTAFVIACPLKVLAKQEKVSEALAA